jgi:hypothetical protein
MTSVITTRQQLTQTIEELPGEMLPELVSFVNYLRLKSQLGKTQPMPVTSAKDNFLLAIAGLGSCEETDLSERDEEILAKEVHPLYGWTLRSEESQ